MNSVDLCIHNAKLVRNGEVIEGGVAVDGEKIVAISKSASLPESDRKIDLGGSLLLPGVVDPHVHFREPGLTHKETFFTGSRSAVAGGVTTVCDMPNTSPPTDTYAHFEEKKEMAESSSLVDFGLHGIVSKNIEEGKKILDAGAPSLKLYPLRTDDSLVSLFQDSKSMLTVHPENPKFIDEAEPEDNEIEYFLKCHPDESEVFEVERILEISTGLQLHFCHLSSRGSLEPIRSAKRSREISGEVTPHHLLLDRSDLREVGAIAKTHPPLRSRKDRLAMLRALAKGDIDIVATDHAPHTLEEKESGFTEAPPGIQGIETSLPLLFTLFEKGELSLPRLVEAMCTYPAKIFGLQNEEGVSKGTIMEGADADLVALDQNESWEIRGDELHGKTKFTPFEGWEVVGKPFLTLVRGEVVYEDGEIVGKKGHGRFVPRQR